MRRTEALILKKKTTSITEATSEAIEKEPVYNQQLLLTLWTTELISRLKSLKLLNEKKRIKIK